MLGFNIDKNKAVNALLHVVSELGDNADCHKTYKILYFADQKHLAKYGRPIIGDTYVKMPYGPVPSFVKNVVEDNRSEFLGVVEIYNDYFINPKQKADLDYLSDSDLECLTLAISENRNKSFRTLTDDSHDSAYENASWQIDYEEMFKVVSQDETMLDYIKINMQNNNLHLL